MTRLIVATNNKGKLKEFCRILTPLGIEVVSPSDLGIVFEVEETGQTFAENARIKAQALHEMTGLPAIADDSGLCVDYLNGRPGVYSARYMGEDTPHSQKIIGLLKELDGVPANQRSARFVAAICCIIDSDTVLECEGICEGHIAFAPKGDGGFGFDPVFLMGEKTFAELSPDEKDSNSHRGKALCKMFELIEEFKKKKGSVL